MTQENTQRENFKNDFMQYFGKVPGWPTWTITGLAVRINAWIRLQGFWGECYPGSSLGVTTDLKLAKHALITTEVAELTEAVRHGNPPSEHIPEFSAEEEELADIIIRVMDYAAQFEFKLEEAIAAKMIYNLSRPPKHGKQA